MTKILILSLLCILTVTVYGQNNKSLENFKADFTKALNVNFSEKELNKMFSDYSGLLTPHSDVTQLSENLKGNMTSMFPLVEFKNEKIYSDNIGNLLASQNANQRILAYLVIASSSDNSKEDILINKIETEKEKGNLIWAGMALLHLQSNQTTKLFDFLVKNEDFGDAHMLPLYFRLNKDSLQQTAYNRINSEDLKSKVLAAQILAVTPLNQKTEQVLKTSVKNWDINIKGYAIYSIKELQIGNLLDTFKPLLNDKKTRSISLQALANSPTKVDNDFMIELVNQQNPVSKDLLDSFFESKKIENLRLWLTFLYTKKLPKDYLFFVFKQPLLNSDAILLDLQIALTKSSDKNILGELVRALDGRDDDKSIEIIHSFLRHKSPTVRYWTAMTVEHNRSEKFKKTEIKKLIKKGLSDGNNIDD